MFLQGKAGKDVLKGGAGADEIYGLDGDDSLSGLGGEDVLVGGAGHDTLLGGADDDYLIGGAGNDLIDGGTGSDWSSYEDVGAAVKVDLTLTTAQNTLGGGVDRLVGVENLSGSAFADTLIGDAGLNYLTGGAGADSLSGGGGEDHLEGGAGNDVLDGGAGDDIVSFDDGVAGGVHVFLGSRDSIYNQDGNASGHGTDILRGIESIWATDYDDVLQGNSDTNAIFGRGGNDTIEGFAGHDYVDGGAGNDLISITNLDADEPIRYTTLIGGDGFDTLSFLDDHSCPVTVDLAQTGMQFVGDNLWVQISGFERVEGSYMGGDVFYASNAYTEFDFGWSLFERETVIYRTVEELGIGDQADRFFGSARIDLSAIDADTTVAGNQAFHWVTRPGTQTPSFPETEPQPTTINTTFTGHAGEVIETDLAGGWCLIQFDVNGDKIADGALLTQFSVPDAFVL